MMYTHLHCIGSAIISMHYQTVMRRCGSVGIPIAFGDVSRGKTNCAKIAIAVCGNYPKGYTGYLSLAWQGARVAIHL